MMPMQGARRIAGGPVTGLAFALAVTGTSALAQDAETPIALRVGESAELAETGLSLTFEEVESDSRCPADVNCVWAGEAVLVFVARADGEEPERLVMKVAPGGEASTHVRGYRIEILALEPQTRSDRRIAVEDYIVTLTVVSDPNP